MSGTAREDIDKECCKVIGAIGERQEHSKPVEEHQRPANDQYRSSVHAN